MRKQTLSLIAALFILLFTYTGINKLMHLQLFYRSLRESILLRPLAPFIGISIPIIELAIAILLFIPSYRNKGLLLSMSLMTAFSLYVGYMLVFATHLPCSCGGVISAMTWKQHLLFNILCSMIAFAGWRLSKQTETKTNCNTPNEPGPAIRAGEAQGLQNSGQPF